MYESVDEVVDIAYKVVISCTAIYGARSVWLGTVR